MYSKHEFNAKSIISQNTHMSLSNSYKNGLLYAFGGVSDW